MWSVICFVKQNTAYDMRISDWSSDVCSSDLIGNTKSRANSSRRSSMKISLTPNCCAFGRTWSSSSPCPMSAVKVTTSASYVSCSHLRMTEVSRPPEYASAILRREELCLRSEEHTLNSSH